MMMMTIRSATHVLTIRLKLAMLYTVKKKQDDDNEWQEVNLFHRCHESTDGE